MPVGNKSANIAQAVIKSRRAKEPLAIGFNSLVAASTRLRAYSPPKGR